MGKNMTFLYLVGGLIFLLAGGEMLVRGSVDLAKRLGLPPLLIGIVIIGFGTSMPEFMVTFNAALEGAPGLAVGNIFGSNISNTLLILGLAAMFFTVSKPADYLFKDAVMLMAITVSIVLLGFQGLLPRWQGAVLVVVLVTLAGFEYWRSKKRVPKATQKEHFATPFPEIMPNILVALFLMAAGFGGLFFGADFFVEGAIALAALLGVSKTFIGLSVAAVGTSLPELVTTILATRRGQAEMAYGNIIGSNLFNILGVLGFATLIQPLEIPRILVTLDGPMMIFSAGLMFWFLFKDSKLSRAEGAVMVMLYLLYLTLRYFFAAT